MPLPVVHVWTDGSGTTRTNPGGWAYVLLCNGHRKEGHGGALDTTNNRMELTAVLKGLEALTKPCRVTVYSDSEYAVKMWKHGWVTAWEAKGWKKVANVDLVLAIKRAKEQHDVTFEWVRGHSKIADNENCDQRAGDCRRKIIECGGDVDMLGALDFEIVDMPLGQQMELAS